MDYKKKILNSLVDKYERSRTFIGKNNVEQSFLVKPELIFKDYLDEASLKLYHGVNSDIDELIELGYASCNKKRNGVVSSVKLNMDKLDEIYSFLGRVPKKDFNSSLLELLGKYTGNNELLDRFINDQIERIRDNKTVKGADDNENFENILKVLANVFLVKEETYQRDFSVKVLGDSKTFEKIRSKVITILMEYGDFDDPENVLEDLNIVKNPGYVYFKGAGIIRIGGQTIDLSKVSGDIGVSSKLLESIEDISVIGKRVVTIENLTTFQAFDFKDDFVIYLGGYHNQIRRNFIRKIYECNKTAEFFHYGDIDAGGFYILLHLRKKTDVLFHAMNMDIDTLIRNREYWKKLTDNDRKRLEKLKETEFKNVVDFMLEHDCKLEQEVLD